MEVLQWALANGCPWDEDTCFCAEQSGHTEVKGQPCAKCYEPVLANYVLQLLYEAGMILAQNCLGARIAANRP
jgi:hypothetical protein